MGTFRDTVAPVGHLISVGKAAVSAAGSLPAIIVLFADP
jgi:hypothetical protein